MPTPSDDTHNPQPDDVTPHDDPANDQPLNDSEPWRHRFEEQSEQLATAEAQRDELQMQLTVTENRHALERALAAAGASDVDLAMAALRQRVDLDEPLSDNDVSQAVEQLLLDKPLLATPPTGTSMPPATSGPRDEPGSETARLSQAARQAALSGNRKDIAEYLRLRRQTAKR